MRLEQPWPDVVFVHDFVNHEVEYAHGNVHCNGVENFWSLLQRTLSGTYVSAEPFHLRAYVDEQAFRFNNRKDNDSGRFLKTMPMLPTARLTYKDLTRPEQSRREAPEPWETVAFTPYLKHYLVPPTVYVPISNSSNGSVFVANLANEAPLRSDDCKPGSSGRIHSDI